MPFNPVITLVDATGIPIGSASAGIPISTVSGSPLTTATGAATALNLVSTAQTAGNTGTVFSTAALTSLAVDINVTAFTGGTSPTVTFFVDRQGADSVWYRIWSSAAVSAVAPLSVNIGLGLTGTGTGIAAAVLTATARFGWTLTGAPTSVTFSASVIGR